MATVDRYGEIHRLWNLAGENITKPPHLQAIDDKARALDFQMGEEFKEPIKQWEDGLIASVDLIDKLLHIAMREVEV
jgi:hypothetical protein